MTGNRSATITPQLIAALRAARSLPWRGIHGVSHWQRVRENGLRLAGTNGADRVVVELFAFIHDIKRQNDGYDPLHGQRAAALVSDLRATVIDIDAAQLELLTYACAHHTEGLMEAEPTVQTCWDADRLDLGRVGIIPDPDRLCTVAARDLAVLRWAIRRSQRVSRKVDLEDESVEHGDG